MNLANCDVKRNQTMETETETKSNYYIFFSREMDNNFWMVQNINSHRPTAYALTQAYMRHHRNESIILYA